MSVSVLNTDAGLSGKTLVNAEDSQTVTGLKTFDRDPNAPFAVSAGSAKVDNLDADKLDGDDWTSGVAQIQAGAGSVSAPSYSKNGDSNTGVYFPAADEVALATGGTKALSIDSTQFIDSPTQPRCSVWANAVAQSIADSTAAAVNWNTEDFDIGDLHSTSANTSRFTVPTGGAGTYLMHGLVAFNNNATGERRVWWKQTASDATVTNYAATVLPGVSGSTNCFIGNTNLAVLAEGDYVECMAFQTSGAAMIINNSSTRNVTGRAFVVKLW